MADGGGGGGDGGSSSHGAGGASLSDLKEVLKETLDARGSLGHLKARIRAEVFAALDDQDVPKPRLSNENLLINELVREYLEYNGYRHALSVFLPESGQPAEKPFHREFLSAELGVDEDPRFKHVPLLYSIIAGLQQQQQQHSKENRADSGGGSGSQQTRDFAGGRDRPSAMESVDPAVARSSPSSPRQLRIGGGVKEPSPLVLKK